MLKRFRLLSILALLTLLASCTQIPAPEFAPDPPLEPLALPNVWINELHYDNDGTDAGEAVEIAGAAGIDLSGWQLVLYNGSSSAEYDTTSLSGVLADDGDGFGFVTVNYPSNGLQNGGPDGLALVSANDGVAQFLSYEGSLTAADGPASGMTSTDIAVSEGSSTAAGTSLQLTGAGSQYADFSWSQSQPSTFGSVNTGQSFGEAGEAPPSVSSTVPAADATGVALDSNLDITFSEPVNVVGDWFVISCSLSGTVGTSVSGGPSEFTLNPATDFAKGESCTVTVTASQVTDQDSDDPPDAMAADYSFNFGTQLGLVKIHAVQGSTDSSPLNEQTVTVEGVVVGDYEGSGAPTLRGFYVQEQDDEQDGDLATSEAVFVFNNTDDTDAVSLGDVVTVSGAVSEFQDQTQISASSITVVGTGSVAPAEVSLPFESADYLERFEGMFVTFPETLYVTEFFQLGRFGQIVVSSDHRLYQPTNLYRPGPNAEALQAANDLNRLIVDDELNNQNPDPIRLARGGEPLSADNTLRGGDTVSGLTGVLTYTWAGDRASGNAYRVRPFNDLETDEPNFVPANSRPDDTPEVGGSLEVASFNVLNYFVTLDEGPEVCGASQNMECRGAESAFELERQRAKLTAALLELDADVVGLVELENTPGVEPAADIANLLNAALGSEVYGALDTGVIGTDAIKVGFIYKVASVTPIGDFAILNSSVDSDFNDDKNRPALAQTFMENATGARVTVVVNHLKSKGSDCDALGDPDAGDGQGNCNLTRTAAAEALADWLANDPTDQGDTDALIIGDLNSYAKEDPIIALEDAGFTNLIAAFGGSEAYSYVFDGQWGYLDHALAGASLTSQVTGAADYHINADEPNVLDYNTNFKSDAQVVSLYAPNEFRTSDHDPLLVGLELTYTPTETLDALQFFVDQYHADGTLNRGQTNALSKKLEHIERKLERGQTKPALNQLRAFENQVQAFARSGKLSQEQSGQLLTLIQALRDSL